MVCLPTGDIEEMAISKFKATCLAVMERVRRTGKPVRVTRFGRPVAEIRPPAPAEQVQRKLGFMAGTLGIEGAIESDIVGPIGALDETQTLKKWDGLNNRPMSRHIAYSAASARAADRPSQRSNSRPAAVTATIAMPPATSRRT